MDIKKGDHVVIKKGTQVRTTGAVRNKVAGRTYKVKVHHTYRAHIVTPAVAVRGYQDVLARRGIDIKALQALQVTNPHAFWREESVVLTSAVVCWAGSGGYWHEADVEEVEKVNNG